MGKNRCSRLIMTQKMFFFAKCYARRERSEQAIHDTYIHQRVPIYQSFLHFYQFNVVVTQSKPVPKYIAISCLSSLSVAILADHILHRVHLVPAVGRIDYDVFATPVRRFNHAHHLGSCALLGFRLFLSLVLLVARGLNVLL